MHYVYIIANRKKGAIYTGQTVDLIQRMDAHKRGAVDGQCTKHNINRLMWFETHETAEVASEREREVRKLKRSARLALFKESNPQWEDLTDTLTPKETPAPTSEQIKTEPSE